MPRPRSSPQVQPPHRIPELRGEAGLTLDQMAERLGTSRQTYHDVETGRTRLSLDWMRRIAAALAVAPAELLDPADLPYRLDAEEQALMLLIRELPDDMRERLPSLIRALQPANAG